MIVLALVLAAGTALTGAVSGVEEQVRALLVAERHAEAVERARAWLAESEATKGAESTATATAAKLLARAMAVGRLGEKSERVALAERAVAIERRLLDADDPQRASAIYVVGLVYNLAEDPASALPHFAEALRIADARSGAPDPELDRFVREYGTALYGVGRYAEARPVFERYLEMSRSKHGASSPGLWQGVFNLALVNKALGDWDAADRLYRDALRLLAAQQPPNIPGTSRTLQSFATLLECQGLEAEAVEKMRSAVDLLRGSAPQSVELASALNNLGNMFGLLGDFEEARSQLAASLAIQEKRDAGDHLGLRTRFNLAAVLLAGSDVRGARALLDEAWQRYSAALSPDDPVWVTFHMHYANVLQASGDVAGARRRLLTALTRLGAVENELTAECLTRLGRLDLAAGDPAAARAHLERALEIVERRLGGRRDLIALEVLDALAEAQAAGGRRDLAFTTAIEAARARRDLAVDTLTVLPERQALAFAARPPVGRDVALTLALDAGDAALAAAVYDAVIDFRAVVFDELVARRSSYAASAAPRQREAATALRAAKSRLANLLVLGPEDDAAGYRGRLDAARAEAEACETRLAGSSTEFRARRAARTFDRAGLRGALVGSEACVSYVRYDARESRAGALRRGPRYAAALQRADTAAPALVDLGPAETLDSAILQWRRALEPEHDEQAQREAGERVRRMLWDPVAGHLGDPSRVYLVPDGAIHLVAFAGLPVGTDRYLIEDGPSFHYLTAERDLARHEPRAPRGRGLLAVGNPAFDDGALLADAPDASDPPVLRRSGPDCPTFRSLRFDALPAAADEAAAVKAIWSERHGGKEPALVLVGAAATERALKRQLEGKRVLHIATHGFFLDGTCGSPGRGAARGIGGISPRKQALTRERSELSDPRLLSGLALAGANRRESATGEDGILTAEEVSALELEGVELAVLSACRSGAGHIESGEGVFGLRRAFLVAGARAVVTNLWDVEDRAALAWIEDFYRERLLRGRALPDAARSASLELLHARRAAGLGTHPFYWSGWLTVGNPD